MDTATLKKIEKHIAGAITLVDDDPEYKMMLRIEKTFSLLQKWKSKRKVVEQIIQSGVISDTPIKSAMAYRYIQYAEKVYGPILEINRKVLRHQVVTDLQEDLIRVDEQIRKIEFDDKGNLNEHVDPENYERLFRIKSKLTESLIKAANLDKEEAGGVNPDEFEGHTYELTYPGNTVPFDLISHKLETQNVIEDVDYEEIKA